MFDVKFDHRTREVPAGHQAVPSLFQMPLQQGAPPGAQAGPG